MSETTNTARVAQLALDTSYYQEKQQEAWDLVNHVGGHWEPDSVFTLSLQLNNSPETAYNFKFKIPANDSIASEIFAKLFFYYRIKAEGSAQLLASLKTD